MRCQAIHQQLAAYRELDTTEQEQLRQHLAGCPVCAAAWADYQAQDLLLATLPALIPSPALATAVRARTVRQRRSPRRLSWQWAAAALSLLLLFTVGWGTVSMAAGALPGDLLYPLKRGTELARLSFTLDVAAREHYQQQLAETRRQEVRAVVTLQRQAAVEFEGRLQTVADDLWLVDGLAVKVSPQIWADAPPPPGSIIFIEAQATAGQLEARRVRTPQSAAPTPTPEVTPLFSPSPTPTLTPSPTGAGTSTPTPSRAATPRTGQPSSPEATPPLGPEPHPTRAFGPGPQPSVTPGAGGPGPQPSATPLADTPGPRPSQPSVTPGAGGPGPQPSATPLADTPGPPPSQPSVTPGAGGPGPQPSVTPGAGGPRPRSSPTSEPTAAPGPGPAGSPNPNRAHGAGK
ncbi:MAG: hypothetical protein H8D78_13195 [Chloroflexi bacterium]|nr:hypothetical protein [Chloroflexota bacterium]